MTNNKYTKVGVLGFTVVSATLLLVHYYGKPLDQLPDAISHLPKELTQLSWAGISLLGIVTLVSFAGIIYGAYCQNKGRIQQRDEKKKTKKERIQDEITELYAIHGLIPDIIKIILDYSDDDPYSLLVGLKLRPKQIIGVDSVEEFFSRAGASLNSAPRIAHALEVLLAFVQGNPLPAPVLSKVGDDFDDAKASPEERMENLFYKPHIWSQNFDERFDKPATLPVFLYSTTAFHTPLYEHNLAEFMGIFLNNHGIEKLASGTADEGTTLQILSK
jgi:hypothetical protein